jgi:hypothetical protein
MASVADILIELVDIQALLASESMSGATKETLVSGVVAKIARLHECRPADALKLMTGIDGVPDAFKVRLQTAIDNRLASATAAAHGEKGTSHNATQELLYPLNYLTSSDWHGIDDPTGQAPGILMVIANRYNLLQVTHPHEQTVKWAVAIAVDRWYAGHQSWPNAELCFQWVQMFKKICERTRQSTTLHDANRMVKYPADPFRLPQAMFALAYPDESDPPVARTIACPSQL